MTLLVQHFEGPHNGNLPPLPDYAAEPVNPAAIAAPNTAELADLYISVGGDGLPLALAGLKNGRKRHEIGDEWSQMSAAMTPDERRQAASQHFGRYLDLSSTGAEVTPGVPGQSTLDYARDVLYRQLRRPARREDTDVRLRTRYDFYVPGTRFDDSFPADNVQVAWALLADGRIQDSLETIANIEHDTMRLGYAPNLSKIGMLRQQTPVDSFAIDSYRGLYGDQVLSHFSPALERNIAFMNSGKDRLAHIPVTGHGAHRRIVRLPGGLHAYRNWDDTPVDFKNRSVIRIESAEKDRALGERIIASVRDTDEKAYLWTKLHKDLGAGAESWQDMSDYQLGDRINLETIRTTEICTSWLQASAAHKIKMAATARELAGDYAGAEVFWSQFNELKTVVNTLMFRQIDETHGYFTDVLEDGSQTGALNAAQMMPLLVGTDFVSYKNARMTVNTMRDELLGAYGLGTSNVEDCKEQWSGKHRNWPSLAAFARLCAMEQAQEAKRRNVPGESPEPFIEFAEEIDAAMTRGIEAWYGEHYTLPERINGENPREVALGGEYCSVDEDGKKPEPQIGFGMTAGAYIVAKTMPIRQIFEHTERHGGSWLSQSFAVHLGRSAMALV
jgi:neutral trehalase